MNKLLGRAAIGGALLLSLSQAGGQAALAQQSCGGGRWAAIGREADAVLLLDQQEGVIYRCPMNYVSRCYRQSSVG